MAEAEEPRPRGRRVPELWRPEAHLFLEQDMAEVQLYPFAGGFAAVFATPNPAAERVSEDAAALIPYGRDEGVILVADGAGGLPEGHHAAALATKSVEATISAAQGASVSLREAILDGFDYANQAIQNLGSGAATTLSLAEIRENVVRTYHAGDSMVLLVGPKGRVKHFTIAHSPVGYAVEAGIIDVVEALHRDDLHIVSNVVGSPDMRIEIGPQLRLADHDTLLIATDGLADNVKVPEIVERIYRGPILGAAESLATLCFERMASPDVGEPSKPDDLTFAIFRLDR